jgi:hypothetical protein
MNKFRFSLTALAVIVFTVAAASSANAQATRTWVSGVGDDVNPCSRTAPCKTFAGAISKTANGGEIDALDPGGFGAVTITKGITIDGTGTLASILFSGTNGVVINATDNDVIILRGLTLNGAGTTLGVDAVRVLQAKAVHLEDVVMQRGSGDGIDILETTNVNVSLRRVAIRHFTTSGIKADTSTGLAKVTIDGSQIEHCGNGVFSRRNARVMVKDSVMAYNTIGVLAENNGGGAAVATLESCVVAFSTSHGVQAGGALATGANSSIVRLSDNQLFNNSGNGALVSTNGQIDTFMNNEITGNVTNGCPACTNATGSFN